MYNHRNGKDFNTKTLTIEDKHLVVTASRAIKAGEQIHNSYNMCKECSGRRIGYGTGGTSLSHCRASYPPSILFLTIVSLEIFRDYGFLEPFPQRFHYMSQEIQFDLDVDPEDDKLVLTWSKKMMPRKDDRPASIVWLKRQIRRLRQLRNVDYKDGNPGMPENEWHSCWEFQMANIQAMTVAIEAIEALEAGTLDESIRSATSPDSQNLTEVAPHYDQLEWEFDDLDYVAPTCNNKEIMKFHDHEVVETLKTHYQNLNFAIHPGSRDVVMDLDNIVQISSNYRPQYHEYVTHAAGRFVKDVRRVIFIGGGDSMLLHETLKYPNLELVVGLELDQIVTRKCFKWFQTQPHFDDPRVEWWFGDATKSLLLLSKEYWQSFDLVLVDLSETVMSLSVTNELDVFDALALLLKHDGVMVKNELYMEPFSDVFDYTLELLYDCPVICSQVLAFGSNKVDFMHDDVYDHGIDTLLYKNMHDPDTRFDFVHDYRVNDARAKGKCGDLPKIEALDEQSKSAGIIEIIEAEKTSAKLDATLGKTFDAILEKKGFQPTTKPIYESGMLYLAMKEGYVMVRMWPDKAYCNIDINLWGKFHMLKELSAALTDALGSERVSKFRIVVGGMYGSTTWQDDRKMIGPQIIQTRNCDEPEIKKAKDVSEEFIATSFEESFKLLQAPDVTAVVVCGDTEDCLAAKLLGKYPKIRKVAKISECADFSADDINTQYECEAVKTVELRKALGNDKADLFVLDSTASFELVQIMNSILSRDDYRKTVIAETNLVVGWSTKPKEEEYQRFFLDRYRKQYEFDPIGRAELWMQAGDKAVEFGLVSAGEYEVAYRIDEFEKRVKKSMEGAKNADIQLRGIYGGLFEYKDPFVPNEFLQSDYDDTPGYQQYYAQNPMARHTIFQLEEDEGKTYNFNKDALNGALQQALDYMTFECTTKFSFPETGEGTVLLCMNPYKGSVVMVWDGRKHVDISFYMMGGEAEEPEKFIGSFLHYTERSLTVSLRDDMPRGTERVINFPEDLMTKEEVIEFYDKLGREEEDDDEEEDEEEPASYGEEL